MVKHFLVGGPCSVCEVSCILSLYKSMSRILLHEMSCWPARSRWWWWWGAWRSSLWPPAGSETRQTCWPPHWPRAATSGPWWCQLLKTIFRSEKQLLLAENGPRSSWAREVLAETTVKTTHAPKLSFNVHFTIGGLIFSESPDPDSLSYSYIIF